VNLSHETYEIHKSRINALKESRQRLQKPVTLLMDTKGPEIRLGVMKEPVLLKSGHPFTLSCIACEGDEHRASLSLNELYRSVEIGSSIFIDDGKIHLLVSGIRDRDIICEVTNEGTISSRKGVNVPGCTSCMPFLSDNDREDIFFAAENDFDTIALSFVRNADDVDTVRALLEEAGKSDIKIIAKIENQQAVDNIDRIIDTSDGIMIGRGDLGIEVSLEDVPIIQKKLIRKCYSRGKPVITATQMLETMTDNLLPTRAEVSDVANAIYDGTSAVMLSGETAMGKHPVTVLKRMVDIINKTEEDIDYRARFYREDWLTDKSIASVLGQAASVAAFELDAKAIVVITNTGNSARMISRFRPKCPIIAITVKPVIERQLNMSWGIHPVRTGYIPEIIALFENTIECAKRTGIVKEGDLVILTAGMPTGYSGKTNLLKIHTIGDSFGRSHDIAGI
jgi:pyruvate kinase